MSPSAAWFALDVAAIASLLLLGLRILAVSSREPAAWLAAALALTGVCNIVLSRTEYAAFIPPELQIHTGALAPALDWVRNLGPGLFLLLVVRLFVDPPRRWAWPIALVLGEAVIETARIMGLAPSGPAATLAAALQGACVAAAVVLIVRDWRADLLEGRRLARAVALLVLSVDMIASSLLLRVVLAHSPASWPVHLALSAAQLAVTLGLIARAFAPGYSLAPPVLAPADRAVEPRPRLVRDPDLERVRTLLETDRIHLQPDLTLAGMAARAGLPEYRLRQAIREGLGYPNFNAFLHALRIPEACAQMGDPAQRRTPILTIALSCGYGSVSAFTRAFRDATGETPSAWRARALGDGETANPEKSPQTLQPRSAV